jgi:hypothetical protein
VRKPLWLLSGAAIAWSGSALGPTSAAFAEQDVFCHKVYQPNETCPNGKRNDWDRVRSRYPGHESHRVFACVYMYNVRTGLIRGRDTWCGFSWSNPSWNPMGHNYGDTYEEDYIAYNYLDFRNCCAHTLIGWTSDNQYEAASADYK